LEYTDTIIMIPARIGSSRLPNKPLLKINGIPLIIHAYNCAKNAKLNAPVVVATDDKLIFKTVSEYGGTALMTSHQHESGSDRILEALDKFDPEKKYKNIIHLQGDLPNISGNLIQKLAQVANDPLKEITTVIVKASPDEFDDPSVVKVAAAFKKDNPKIDDVGRALYFSRACIPTGSEHAYHHIGIYAFTNKALSRYVGLKRSKLELERKLEQLRAMENGMSIHVGYVDSSPLSVDTEQDLEEIKKIMKTNE